MFTYKKKEVIIIRDIKEMRGLFEERGYKLLSDEYKGNKEPLVFEKDGYAYCNTYNGFIKTDNPKKWGKNNPYSIYNLRLWLKRQNAPCRLPEQEFDYDRVELICTCGNRYNVAVNNLIRTRQFTCPECGRERASIKHRQDDKFLSVLEEKGLSLVNDYRNAKTVIYMKTNDGYYVKSTPWNIANGADERDTIFDIRNKYSVDNMRHFLDVENLPIELVSDKYTGSKARYKFRCSCGKEFETTWQYVYFNKISRCLSCSQKESGLELKTEQWLIDNNVDYVKQKTFSDCVDKRPLRFDFYLPEYNTLIEVDGQQHYRESAFGGISKEQAKANFNDGKRRDKIKDEYCNNHGYKLVRIPYLQYNTDKYKETLKTSTAKI